MISESFFDYCNKNNKLLLTEWDYSKNDKGPNEYGKSSGKDVFWICKKEHSWTARISDRVRGNGCPYCAGKRPIIGVNDLETVNPVLAGEWNYSRNSKTPSEFLPNSGKKVWWICTKGHEWEATIDSRSRGTGCRFCAGQAVITGENDLKSRYPRLAEEWDYELNKPDRKSVV